MNRFFVILFFWLFGSLLLFSQVGGGVSVMGNIGRTNSPAEWSPLYGIGVLGKIEKFARDPWNFSRFSFEFSTASLSKAVLFLDEKSIFSDIELSLPKGHFAGFGISYHKLPGIDSVTRIDYFFFYREALRNLTFQLGYVSLPHGSHLDSLGRIGYRLGFLYEKKEGDFAVKLGLGMLLHPRETFDFEYFTQFSWQIFDPLGVFFEYTYFLLPLSSQRDFAVSTGRVGLSVTGKW